MIAAGRAADIVFVDAMTNGEELVVVDVETTGTDPRLADVVEIAAVKVKRGKITDRWSTLVNPGRPIVGNQMHGIKDAAILLEGVTIEPQAEFDENKPVNLEGTLTKADWVNPHAWLYIDVKGKDGTVSNWAVEMGPPNALLRRGWKRSSMQLGAVLKVEGFAAKNGKDFANATNVTLASKFGEQTEVFNGVDLTVTARTSSSSSATTMTSSNRPAGRAASRTGVSTGAAASLALGR